MSNEGPVNLLLSHTASVADASEVRDAVETINRDLGFEVFRLLSPDLPQLLDRQRDENLALYLANASLDDLACLTGALAAELAGARGIRVADLLGGMQARIEAAREHGRA